ncbi:MAG TPA: nuclear transport factor 2 family protein [Pyrinomonadaceae bacterium]
MKRCATCNKTFTDPKLSYCLDDGTPLVEVDDDEDELTQVNPGTNWTQPAYRPPSYVPPGSEQKKSRTWLYVTAVIGVLVLALVGFTIAGIVYLPRLQKKVAQANNNTNTNTNTNNATTNSNSNSVNANTEVKNANANANEEAALNAPPPTDHDLVLGQLKDLEQEWTVANLNADKKKLAKILADDYVGPTADGKIQGKAEYINTIQRDTSVQKWDFVDLRLTLHGDRATLLGKVHFQIQDKEAVYDFVDRFVWREGRWQATGSEVTLNQDQGTPNNQ